MARWTRSARSSAALAVAAVVLAAALPHCARSRVEVRRERGLNVLLITIDTLRADALGAYGRATAATPWIDRLAGAGVRFDDARAHNVVTLPSHANILSGRLPLDHGIRDNAGFRFPANVETLATLLDTNGYRTGAFVSAFPLASRFGLARGFDVYDDAFADAGPRPAFLIQERRGSDTVARAQRWIESVREGPWLCWVHLFEPHFPYEPSQEFAWRFPGDPYHGEVSAADAALAPLVAPILDMERTGRTLVVLTSDHGEALGDHGEATHGVFAYEAVLKVPLVLYQPRLFAPAVVTAPARHVDLLPTILDTLSLPVPVGLAGRSLLPAIAGVPDDTAPITYFEALSPSLNRGWAPLAGVVRDRTKYIDLPIPELYDLQADPLEARNLAGSTPQRLDEMRALLARLRRTDEGIRRTAEDAETRERLRSLGYLASSVSRPARYGEEDDPKRLIGLDALLQEVVARYLDGDLQGALAQCRELVRRRPEAALSLLQLAHLEREAGNLPAAVETLRKVVAQNPNHGEAVSLLGASLIQAGRAREAVDLLEPYARRADAAVGVLTAHALALAALGRPRDALVTLATARERDPSNAMTLVELGTVHVMAGDRDRARQAFERAVEMNPGVARAHSSLGVLAVETGRRGQAFERWRIATSLDPREHEKILALGIAFDRAGRMAEAQACFEFFVESAPPARYRREIERARLWLKQ